MRPRRRPYNGKIKFVKKDLPRFIQLGDMAIESGLVDYITTMRMVGNNETIIHLQIPKFFAYEEKQIRVRLALWKVVKILNQFK